VRFRVIFLILFQSVVGFSQIQLLSWNIENLGQSKSDKEILFIAQTVKDFDLVAIQEVVAGFGGSQAVARLANELNRKGHQWDYRISNPTSSSAYKTERYAFLWKKSRAKLKGKPWLENKYHIEIDREPYYATFEIDKKEVTLVNFHAITKSKQPEREIKFFKFLPATYPKLNLLFLGDFNCPQSHSVFTPLKKIGYTSSLANQKTSLKKKCKNNTCLASEFDNFFYNQSKISMQKSGVLHFYTFFESIEQARKISDHIPIWIEFSIK
jgi:deoxyribonuclease-1-like protein